jgi:hypothetical protein
MSREAESAGDSRERRLKVRGGSRHADLFQVMQVDFLVDVLGFVAGQRGKFLPGQCTTLQLATRHGTGNVELPVERHARDGVRFR